MNRWISSSPSWNRRFEIRSVWSTKQDKSQDLSSLFSPFTVSAKGIILRIGANRSGYWGIIDT